MSKYFLIAAGLIAGMGVVWTEPVAAHGHANLSVTIGSAGYYRQPGYYNYYYQPPGVTVYPQPQYYYGVPPSAIVPPPVIYYPPQPVYRYYYNQPPARLNVYPYGNGHWQHDGNRNWNR
jgi:hypothetical protein